MRVSREFVIEHGIVGHLRDLKDLTHPDIVSHIGTRLLVVRAIGWAAPTEPTRSFPKKMPVAFWKPMSATAS